MDYSYREDTYTTPDNYPRFFCDRIVFNTRLFFYYRILKLVYDTNKVIRKGKFSDKAWSEASYYALRSIEGCGGKVNITGMQNITACDGPVVFIGNHMSVLETFALPGIVCPRKPISFVVKKSLVEYPFFGLVMRTTKPVVVGRTDPAKDFKAVMNDGTALIKEGHSIVVFPQSTRSVEFKPNEFNSIGVKLAKKAGVPIVPIALKTDFWGNGKKIKDFGKITRNKKVYIEFGEPIKIEGNGKAEHAKIVEFIQTRLVDWKKNEKLL